MSASFSVCLSNFSGLYPYRLEGIRLSNSPVGGGGQASHVGGHILEYVFSYVVPALDRCLTIPAEYTVHIHTYEVLAL